MPWSFPKLWTAPDETHVRSGRRHTVGVEGGTGWNPVAHDAYALDSPPGRRNTKANT